MNLQDLEDFTGFEGGASTAFSSPGAPSIFDLPGASSHPGTVSPQDLLLQDPYMSAPNSSALTALTSPSPYESPDFVDGYDVSPNFSTADFDGASTQWYSLFPDQPVQGEVKVAGEDQSPMHHAEELDIAQEGTAGQRKSGSPSSTRHSSVAGVGSRKRDKPLPPIVVDDPNDIVAMKRARNTLAARKSRERKALKVDELEARIAKLVEERDHWKSIALSGRST